MKRAIAVDFQFQTYNRRYKPDLEYSPLSSIVKQSQTEQNKEKLCNQKQNTVHSTQHKSHYWCAERDQREEDEKKMTMKNETNGCRLKCLASKEVSYDTLTSKTHDLYKYNSIRFQLLNVLCTVRM